LLLGVLQLRLDLTVLPLELPHLLAQLLTVDARLHIELLLHLHKLPPQPLNLRRLTKRLTLVQLVLQPLPLLAQLLNDLLQIIELPLQRFERTRQLRDLLVLLCVHALQLIERLPLNIRGLQLRDLVLEPVVLVLQRFDVDHFVDVDLVLVHDQALDLLHLVEPA
jgi:hypothetical protein